MKQKTGEKQILTTHEAAKLLYVTPTTVIQWIKDGKMKVIRTAGGHRRIPIHEIERLMEENKMFLNAENTKTVLIFDKNIDNIKRLMEIASKLGLRSYATQNFFELGILFEKKNLNLLILNIDEYRLYTLDVLNYIKNSNQNNIKIIVLTENMEENTDLLLLDGISNFIEFSSTDEEICSKIIASI